MIERLNRSHVDAAAQLHLRSLTGLLRDLGPGAVRAFYHGAARSSSVLAFVCMEESKVAGFVLGSVEPGRVRREILANSFFRTVLGTCSGVLRSPGTFRGLVSSFLPGKHAIDSRAAELTYLAVDPDKRSLGVGRQLVERFSEHLRESEVSAYELSVDAGNAVATRFYERLGFTEIGQYREFGIDRKRFRLELT